MTAEGYAMKTERWFFCQMQDSAVMYMWQDILAAFAARHRDDTRIAAVLFDELYPRMWEPHVDLCGNVHELDDPQAVNSAQMELMKAYLEQDPGMLCAPINWYSGIEPIREKWEKGFGNGSPGADDLPGVQGHYRQDPRFFQNGLGKDAESGIDDIRNSFMNDYLIQYYGVKKLAPVFAGTEGTGWYLDTHDYRTGNENPWNAAPWPQEGDSLPNDDGNPMPSARFWAWYYSGAPKAKGGAADSRLGQEGPDPSGVVPANFYCPDVVEGNRFGHSVERWLAAFRTFGPKGTQAMFAHPDGYLEQFEKMSRKKQNGSNE
ncbi:MAG: hypothetical protein BWZ10_02811 [candidate division BRC1 bacterium ADurb.BinA364]|nr:MAG: hypothetical protein BWZ10_02811 [candidate division BRC1 bacterium ADurb.BinA364]